MHISMCIILSFLVSTHYSMFVSSSTVLMGEKIDAESRLEQELSRRKEFEDGIKRASEEEKQQLIDEAEEKMISLRDEISQLKSDLCRDCCSLKNVNVELQEKEKKLDARATALERVLTLVRDQLATVKMEKLSLQEKLQALVELNAVFKSQVSKLFESISPM